MIEENLRLIGQKVKIISPKIRLHKDMKQTINSTCIMVSYVAHFQTVQYLMLFSVHSNIIKNNVAFAQTQVFPPKLNIVYSYVIRNEIVFARTTYLTDLKAFKSNRSVIS